MGVILDGVHDDVEQGDSATGVWGVLFHVEEVGGEFIVL